MKKVLSASIACILLLSSCKKDDNSGNNQTPELGEMYFKGTIGTDSIHYTVKGEGGLSNTGQSSGLAGCNGVGMNLGLSFYDPASNGASVSMSFVRCMPEGTVFCHIHEWLYEEADYSCVTNASHNGRNLRFKYTSPDNTQGNYGVYIASSGLVRITLLEEIDGNRIISGSMNGTLSAVMGSSSKPINAIFRVKIGTKCQ